MLIPIILLPISGLSEPIYMYQYLPIIPIIPIIDLALEYVYEYAKKIEKSHILCTYFMKQLLL